MQRSGIIFWRRKIVTCDMKRAGRATREGYRRELELRCENQNCSVADRDAWFLLLHNRAGESAGPEEVFGSIYAGER